MRRKLHLARNALLAHSLGAGAVASRATKGSRVPKVTVRARGTLARLTNLQAVQCRPGSRSARESATE